MVQCLRDEILPNTNVEIKADGSATFATADIPIHHTVTAFNFLFRYETTQLIL